MDQYLVHSCRGRALVLVLAENRLEIIVPVPGLEKAFERTKFVHFLNVAEPNEQSSFDNRTKNANERSFSFNFSLFIKKIV